MSYNSYQQNEVECEVDLGLERGEPAPVCGVGPLSGWLTLGLCASGVLMLLMALTPAHNSIELRTRNIQEMSFGQLASESFERTRVLHKFEKDLDDLQPGCSPLDIHQLRIATGRLRDFLDIFAPAYLPVKGTDVWHLIRKDLAAGYAILGTFQDLEQRGVAPNLTGISDLRWNASRFTNNITQSELDSLRNASLEWKTNHMALQRAVDMKNYIRQPWQFHFFSGTRHLSRFFWGGIQHQPTSDYLGLYWIASLLQCRLTGFDVQYHHFANLTTIIDENNHRIFHDYRKSARALLAIARTVPSAFLSMADSDLIVLQTIFHDVGKVNNVYNFYVHLNNTQQPSDPANQTTNSELAHTEKALKTLLQQVQAWCAKNGVNHLGWRLKLQLSNYRTNVEC